MIRRKNIYKGFNKRKVAKAPKVIAVVLCVSLVGGLGFKFVKSSNFSLSKLNPSNMISKLAFWDKGNKDGSITDKDISKELEDINKSKETESQERQIAKIEKWKVYTVQAGASENESDIKNMENTLEQSKIPYSTVQMDGTNKVQTYTLFDEESARGYLDEVREVFPDAFLSSVEMPVLALEYTEKYAYAKNISEEFGKLITNFEEESNFWKENKENIDTKKRSEILTKRSEIIANLETEANKIDVEGMQVFKDGVLDYTKLVTSNSSKSSKSTNEGQYNVSEGLFLSSIHGYYNFISKITQA